MTEARSIYRPKESAIPTIATRWAGTQDKHYHLRSWHLEEYAIFQTFNEPFFRENLLPDGTITYRSNPSKSVSGSHIKALIDKLITEIHAKKKVFTDFDVLCKKDFNRRACSGLMILKCKHHPFVVKLFIENPKSFVKYASKGIVPTFVYFMSGGINRHLVGFTRVKNLQILQEKIAHSPEWSTKVTFPRKWFVLPTSARWIEITGDNIGATKHHSIQIPGTYCIIADWIDADRPASMFNPDDKKTCMSLCNFFGLAIDPHINNFLYEKGTGKIAIIDTEHFLSLVGIKDPIEFTGYFAWLWHLGNYCLHRMLMMDKKDRAAEQLKPSRTQLRYDEYKSTDAVLTATSTSSHPNKNA